MGRRYDEADPAGTWFCGAGVRRHGRNGALASTITPRASSAERTLVSAASAALTATAAGGQRGSPGGRETLRR